MSDPQVLNPSEWYFTECPAEEALPCSYYEYARSSPTMIKAIANVHEAVHFAVTEFPRPNDVALLTNRFPAMAWLDIPRRERTKILKEIAQNLPSADLLYHNRWLSFEDQRSWELMVREADPPVVHSEGVTTALIRLHWNLGNAELKEAFQNLLRKYRPARTGPKQGRIKSEFDYLNSLGAKRMMEHCAQSGAKYPAKAAFDEMKRQVDASAGTMRMQYAKPSALALAAGKATKYVLELYGIKVDRRLQENQVMTDEEINIAGPVKCWFPGIYLEDPPGFG